MINVVDLLVSQGLAKTRNEARRLIGQGGVKLNGFPLRQPAVPVEKSAGVLQVGTRYFRRLVPPER
jgi:tyrosyl-tRNA synthetase